MANKPSRSRRLMALSRGYETWTRLESMVMGSRGGEKRVDMTRICKKKKKCVLPRIF